MSLSISWRRRQALRKPSALHPPDSLIETLLDKEELLELFREIVGSIVILFDPLPTAALARLLDKPKEEVDQTLNDLYSVLEVAQRSVRQGINNRRRRRT